MSEGQMAAARQGLWRAALSSKSLAAHLLAAVLPILVVWGFRAHYFQSGESTNDAYYHMYMADQGPSAIFAKKFPGLTMSTWTDSFSDKELLYHLELWAIRKAELALGASKDPPFTFPAMAFVMVAMAGFAFASWRLGASPLMTFGGTMAMAILIPLFTMRLIMLRPHVPAIGFMLAACGIYGCGTLKSKLVWGSALSFAFAWSYSNPHFIAIPALAFGLVYLEEHGKASLLIPACALGAVAAGLVIHPQFPNSILMWKVQCVDAFLWPIVMNNSPIGKPAEMWAPNLSWLMKAAPFFILAYIEAIALRKLYENGGLKGIPRSTRAVALLAGLFLAGTVMANRSIEYACPFAALLGVLLLRDLKAAGLPYPFKGRPFLGAGVMAGVCAALAFWMSVFLSDGRVVSFNDCQGLAAWLRCNAPKGSTLANLNWSDFPQLIYAAPDYKCVWGMDPMFSYAIDKKRTVELDRLCDEKRPPGPEALRAITAADYAPILSPDMAKTLALAGWPCVYNGADGWIFHLNAGRVGR